MVYAVLIVALILVVDQASKKVAMKKTSSKSEK